MSKIENNSNKEENKKKEIIDYLSYMDIGLPTGHLYMYSLFEDKREAVSIQYYEKHDTKTSAFSKEEKGIVIEHEIIKKINEGFFENDGLINWDKFMLFAQHPSLIIDKPASFFPFNLFSVIAESSDRSIINFIAKNKKSLADYYGYNENEIQIINLNFYLGSNLYTKFINLVNPNVKMVIGNIGVLAQNNVDFPNLERVWGSILIKNSKNISFNKLDYVMGSIDLVNTQNISFNKLQNISYDCNIYFSNKVYFPSLIDIVGDLLYSRGCYDICFNKLTNINGDVEIGRIVGHFELNFTKKQEKEISQLYKETDGFPELKYIKGKVTIWDMPCIFSKLEKVDGSLRIETFFWNNYYLPEQYKLNFSSLQQVGKTLYYDGDGKRIIGFKKLVYIGGSLRFSSGKNIDLTNLITAKKISIKKEPCDLPKLKLKNKNSNEKV